MKRRTAIIWAVQVILAVAIGVFLWRAIARNWSAFRAIDVSVSPHPEWIVLSVVTVLVTYTVLIEGWRRVLQGWGQRLPYRAAVRIWTLSNLGRYLPGKIWSLAGLTVLAQRAGVAGWAAGGSAVAMQVLAVGTGVAAVAATAPGAVSPLSLVLAGALAVAAVLGLLLPAPFRVLARMLDRDDLQPLTAPALVSAALATASSWVAYGIAFWFLARGLLGSTPLPLPTAVGVFAAGYITGLLAIIVPGGVGVREVIFIGLLTPSLGSGGAVVLTVGSRLLLTVTEAAAAFAGLLLRGDQDAHDGD